MLINGPLFYSSLTTKFNVQLKSKSIYNSTKFYFNFKQDWEINFTQCLPNGYLYTDLCNIFTADCRGTFWHGGISFRICRIQSSLGLEWMRVRNYRFTTMEDIVTGKTWISTWNSRSVRARKSQWQKKIVGSETFGGRF
jgi:hypothetical protein